MTVVKLNIDGVEYTCSPTIPSTGLLLVPAGITPVIHKLDALAGWTGVHDAATPGTASGGTTFPVDMGGRNARLFSMSYTQNGGMRFHCPYGQDTASKHFVYAGDLFIDGPQPIAQMELDNNQVTADGKTYIFGAQQNVNDLAWDVSSAVLGKSKWNPTAMAANPKTWPVGEWMHFEIFSERDDAGNITYRAIHWNGKTMALNLKYTGALPLGWKVGVELVNCQINGYGAAGSIKVYGSNFQIAKW